jgi:hypothetical protein
MVAPNADFALYFEPPDSIRQTEPQPLDKETAAALWAQKLRIVEYGDYIYDDVFGCHHWMTFCVVTAPHSGYWGYQPCTVHNDAGDFGKCEPPPPTENPPPFTLP